MFIEAVHEAPSAVGAPPVPLAPLRGYQELGVQLLARQPRAAGLIFDTRLGKTRTVIEALAVIEHATNAARVARDLSPRTLRVLVLGPPTARLVWPAEFAKWAPAGWNVYTAPRGLAPPTSGALGYNVDAPVHVLIQAYNILGLWGAHRTPNQNPWWRALSGGGGLPKWDVLVLDEAHALKTPGANITRAVYGALITAPAGRSLAGHARRVWLLSATLMPMHAGELWTHYHALWPAALGGEKARTYREFTERFCLFKGRPESVTHHYGRLVAADPITHAPLRVKGKLSYVQEEIIGSRNVHELREALSPFLIRRRKRDFDVLPSLPPLSQQDLVVDPATVAFDAEIVKTMEKLDHLSDAALEDMILGHVDLGLAIATVRRAIGVAKVDAALDWITDGLDAGLPKIVVFGWHPIVLDALASRLAAQNILAVTLHGQSSNWDVRHAVEVFQRAPEVRVFLGQIRAAGVAIDLSAAEDALMVEPSWNPADNYQAISRIESIVRPAPRSVTWLVLGASPGPSLDRRILSIMRRRQRDSEKMFR